MTLPPHVPETDFGNIPAPVGWIVGPCGQFHPNPASEVNGPGSVAWSIPCYTESSMRAYATAAVLAERETCAKLCDSKSTEGITALGPSVSDLRQIVCGTVCADAIRNRG